VLDRVDEFLLVVDDVLGARVHVLVSVASCGPAQ
jgi:hypothetical protein